MSALKNDVLLRNRKAENRPLMKVMCSLLLLAPCLSALMIVSFYTSLITVKLGFLPLPIRDGLREVMRRFPSIKSIKK